MPNGRMTDQEWRGWVQAKLERIPAIERKVDGLMWKVAGVGATAALLTSLVLRLIN